jgi:hypothetical protein
LLAAAGALLASALAVPADDRAPADAALAGALTLHASFDTGPDADLARGDNRIHTGEMLGKNGKPGLLSGNVAIARGKGRRGDALEFKKKEGLCVYYRAGKNVTYRKEGWSGTVSLWLSLDPDRDLEPGFCDPVQITERAWNDGAFFVDFTKDDSPRHFRLGAFADRKVWDPTAREWDSVPVAERPMVEVAKPPFARGKWTHVAWTFTGFNTGKDGGVARFYLDGKFQGELRGRRQTFTWDPEKAVIMLGLSYIGLMDELNIFERALDDAEIQQLYNLALAGPIKPLGK